MNQFLTAVPLPRDYPPGTALFRSYDPMRNGDPTPHLLALADAGVTNVINLMEPDETARRWAGWEEAIREFYRGHGLTEDNFPIRDFSLPSLAMLDTICQRLEELLEEGRRVVVHCHQGIGRTGAVLDRFLERARG